MISSRLDADHCLNKYFSRIFVQSAIVMYRSFTYAELQERFCEGFAFFPFTALEQHGRFIYKRYAAGDNTAGLLDSYNSNNDGGVHAGGLLVKLQQQDIPLAAELLERLQSEHAHLEERVRGMKRKPAIYKQLLETMDTYHRILLVYQQQVQQQIVAQLLALCDKHGPLFVEGITAENLTNINAVVLEFLQSTEILYGFLYGCIRQMPGFKKLVLNAKETEEMETLLKMVRAFRALQRKTSHLLEEWKKEGTRQREQRTMN